MRRLPEMVARDGKPSREKSNVIPGKVFEKSSRHDNLCERLRVRFRRHAHDESSKVFLNVWPSHRLGEFG